MINLDQEIIRVLAEAGDRGLSMKKITMHVYNHVNGLFFSVDFDEVRRLVVNFVNRNARQSGSVIERTNERGIYRLNKCSGDENQLKLDFKDFLESEKDNSKSSSCDDKDCSLSLFD